MTKTITVNKKSVIITSAVALVVLFAGSAMATAGNAAVAAAPAVTITPEPVTATADPLPAMTVTATPEPVTPEPVTVTPQACLDALDEAEVVFTAAGEGFGLFGEFANLSAQAITAAAEWDSVAMDRLTVDIGGVSDELAGQAAIVSSSDYSTFAATCRAAS